MPAARAGRVLCRLDELPDNGSRGFSLDGDPCQELFLIRRDARVYAYRNSCPHTGAPLDWQPHQFLDVAGTHILCAGHAAQFRIDDGVCIAGPCVGARLTPLRVEVIDGAVVLTADPGDLQQGLLSNRGA